MQPKFIVPANWEIPESLRTRLGRSAGSQRILIEEGHLFIVAHDVPEPDEMFRKGILLWRDPAGEWRASSGQKCTVAMEKLLERYKSALEDLDRDSQKLTSDDYLNTLERLTPITRAMKHLSTVLAEAREAFPMGTHLIDWSDTAYELSRTAELQYQYTRDDMNVAAMKRAEEQAASSQRMAVAAHRLNIMAAFFFPLVTLSSIFGTTLTEEWSWSNSSIPFALMLVVGLGAGMILTFALTGKSR